MRAERVEHRLCLRAADPGLRERRDRLRGRSHVRGAGHERGRQEPVGPHLVDEPTRRGIGGGRRVAAGRCARGWSSHEQHHPGSAEK